MPGNAKFGPLGGAARGNVIMTVDEYETIRLIDMEGCTQEQCANQMGIARTTVQGMYNVARKKIAEVLVNGNMLLIQGGSYVLCDGQEEQRGCCGCHRHRHGDRRGKQE